MNESHRTHYHCASIFCYFYCCLFLVCGGYIEADHGAINSPGYPGDYPPSRFCQWIVKVAEGKKISFSFAHLAMEHHSNCSYDFLQVRKNIG